MESNCCHLVILPKRVIRLPIFLYSKLKATWLTTTIEVLSGVYYIFRQMHYGDCGILTYCGCWGTDLLQMLGYWLTADAGILTYCSCIVQMLGYWLTADAGLLIYCSCIVQLLTYCSCTNEDHLLLDFSSVQSRVESRQLDQGVESVSAAELGECSWDLL
jgi:hypothetical protein